MKHAHHQQKQQADVLAEVELSEYVAAQGCQARASDPFTW